MAFAAVVSTFVEEVGIGPQGHRRVGMAHAAADLDRVDAGGDRPRAWDYEGS